MKYSWIILLVLAGCGGGSAGGGTAIPPADFDGLYNEITGLGVTPVTNLPVQGSAAYSGLIRLNLPIDGPAQAFEGAFDVAIGFEGGGAPVTGAVSDLAAGPTILNGTLLIDMGVLNPSADPGSDYQFTADMGGTLDDRGTIYVLDGTLAGDFYGTQLQGIAGVVFGDITQGAVVDIFDGAFAGNVTP